jgi:hypothetical protein
MDRSTAAGILLSLIVAFPSVGVGQATLPQAVATALRTANPPAYREGHADLNGDGSNEALALLSGPEFCGSGGCTLLVFRGAPNGYTLVSRLTVTSAPVRVAKETSHGWKNLIVHTRGGDAVLVFNGRAYPGNPSVQPKAKPSEVGTATVVIN